MEKIWQEFGKGGTLRIRDQWQFEIQSNFYHLPEVRETIQTQEFYFFIPNSLQINNETYSKKQFYQDQTNLIRFKTPEFTLMELLDPQNSKSPLYRIEEWSKAGPLSDSFKERVQDELKLLGNILKSSFRRNVKKITAQIDARPPHSSEAIKQEIETFLTQLDKVLIRYSSLQKKYEEASSESYIHNTFFYVKEFVSNEVNYYLTVLLQKVRDAENKSFEDIDKRLCDFILREKKEREQRNQEPEMNNPDSLKNEFISHQNNLLKKFVMGALLPDVTRLSSDSAIQNVIGSFSAGIAMFFYLLLFIWGGNVFVINSFPFVVVTVLFYVLKDRLKEALKILSYRQTLKWISDYTTKIRFRNKQEVLGNIRESFVFIEPRKVPKDITELRNQGFHSTLETFKRPEAVFYYKKMVGVYHDKVEFSRRHELHNLFRFNVHAFLQKASDPYFQYTSLDSTTRQLEISLLPKVYHVNIILKTTYQISKTEKRTSIKKFRVIIDKTGIKRLEEIK